MVLYPSDVCKRKSKFRLFVVGILIILYGMLFELICLLHIFIWVFVLFAFVNKKSAYYNIYFVIPFIYLVHILPFHILTTLKEKIDPVHHRERVEKVSELLVFPKLWLKMEAALKKFCFLSPISTQGMLILGLITSIFVLHPPLYLRKK
jgi:hypothetical protein